MKKNKILLVIIILFLLSSCTSFMDYKAEIYTKDIQTRGNPKAKVVWSWKSNSYEIIGTISNTEALNKAIDYTNSYINHYPETVYIPVEATIIEVEENISLNGKFVEIILTCEYQGMICRKFIQGGRMVTIAPKVGAKYRVTLVQTRYADTKEVINQYIS